MPKHVDIARCIRTYRLHLNVMYDSIIQTNCIYYKLCIFYIYVFNCSKLKMYINVAHIDDKHKYY